MLVVVRSEQGPSDLAGEVVGGLSMARGAQHRLHLGAPARLAALALVLQCSDEPRPLAVVGEILEATRGRCGGQRTNLRRTVDAIRWVLHTGGKWRDIPAELGAGSTSWRWYERWSGNGTWQAIAALLAP